MPMAGATVPNGLTPRGVDREPNVDGVAAGMLVAEAVWRLARGETKQLPSRSPI